MSKFLLYFVTIVIVIGCSDSPKPISDSRINDYALYDEAGGFHRFSHYNDSKGIVLFVQGNGCPIVRNALGDFSEIVSRYSKKGFTFFMINSQIQDNRKSIQKEASEFNFMVPVLDDNVQLIADELDITITAEVLILHPTSREILFRGPINNRLDYETQKEEATENYLKNALDDILKGMKPVQNREMTRGCTVTRLSKIEKNDTLTYTKDIAPILQENCIKCHVNGGIAPWSMTDYNKIMGWSSMMKQVLLSKRMPPWKADPQIGEFENSFALEDSNTRKVIRWIDNGLNRGEGEDILTNISPLSKDWELGEPDEIHTLETEIIPATGNIDYRFQYIVLKNSEDRWLRGIEIQPGNQRVVHHIVVTNTSRNWQSPITDRQQRKWTDNYIAIGVSAVQATFFPEGSGIYIPKNTEITVQFHYTTTGKPETDQTRIGMYYHNTPPLKEFYSLAPSTSDFVIPPFGKNIHIIAEDSIQKDIKLYYIGPHMHYRGKSIKFSVIYPDKTKETIVSVPDFNFNWQQLYRLREPISVPKGSKFIVEGIFDNTYQNPLNPNPEKEVTFGIQSTDEMLIGFFNYTLDD